MQILKSLEVYRNNFGIKLLCLILMIWALGYFRITELLTFNRNILVQKQSNNAIFLLIICAIFFIVFYFDKKQNSNGSNYAEMVMQEKAHSLRRAFTFACRIQKAEHADFVRDGLVHNFKKDFLEGGFYWAKYMLWRDNIISLHAVIRTKVIKLLS